MRFSSYVRRAFKHLWFQLLLRSGATAWARQSLRRRHASIVVTLHRVLPFSQLQVTNSPAGMVVEEAVFCALLDYLASRLSFGSLLQPSIPASPLRCFLTFDDGWQDNFDVAAPQLSRRSIPATIFVCSERVGLDQPFWPETAVAAWRAAQGDLASHELFVDALLKHGISSPHHTESDFLYSLKQVAAPARKELLHSLSCSLPLTHFDSDRTMDWDQIEQLSMMDISIGNHTAHHEILPALSVSDQLSEILQANDCLNYRLGQKTTLFSYPNGDWNQAVRTLVGKCSIKHAFINSPGVWSPQTDPLLIPRINLSQQKLVGLTGRFSAASVEYFLFWLPYLAEARSRLSALRASRNIRSRDAHAGLSAIAPSKQNKDLYIECEVLQ